MPKIPTNHAITYTNFDSLWMKAINSRKIVAKQINKTSVCFCNFAWCGLMHAVRSLLSGNRLLTPLSRRRDSGDGRRYDTSLISIPDVAILWSASTVSCPLHQIRNGSLPATRQQGVWEREGMVVWLCACVRYGHDVVMCRVSIGFRCLCTGEVTWNPRTILRYHGGHSSMT